MTRLLNALLEWRSAAHKDIRWLHLLIFLFPVSVLTASEYVLGNFGNPDLDLGPVELINQSAMAELAGRYRYMAAVFFYVSVAVSLILVFAFELLSEQRLRSIAKTLIALIGAVGVALIFSIFEPVSMRSFESYELLGEALFREALGQGQIARCAITEAADSACETLGAFAVLTSLNGAVNLISALASASVIAGCILGLSRTGPADLTTREGLLEEGQALEAAQNAVRRYLYAAAVLLTIGMALGLTWMSWPTALIADPELKAAHQSLVDGVSLFRGVSYSALIMSFYIPVSLFLMVRTNRFNAAAAALGSGLKTEEAERLKLRIGGFDIERLASLDALKAVLAISSPIVTSALGSFDKLPALL
ncbi:MAG: hypothetical protein AAGA08_09825 [Pseudomonadota bacterium]